MTEPEWIAEIQRILDAIIESIPEEHISDALIERMGWCLWCRRKLNEAGECGCWPAISSCGCCNSECEKCYP